MTEAKAIEIMKEWIKYEKVNKDKINKADELIEVQETIVKALENSIPKEVIIEKLLTDKAKLNKCVNTILEDICKARIEFAQELLEENKMCEYQIKTFYNNGINRLTLDVCAECIKQNFKKKAEEKRIMLVKFKNIGRNNINFERKTKELTYDWLLKQVRPHLLSHIIDFDYNKKRNNNSICRNADCRRNRGGTIRMSKNLLGKHVVTYDNHEGIVINQYKPTGKNQESVHIQQRDGRIWFCPIDNIKMEV